MSAGPRPAPDAKSSRARFGAGARIAPGGCTLAASDDVSCKRLVGGAYSLVANALTGVHLLVLLDNPLEIFTHLGDRLARYLHLTIGAPPDQDVELAVARILLRKIVPEVSAAALLSFQSRAGDYLRYDQ